VISIQEGKVKKFIGFSVPLVMFLGGYVLIMTIQPEIAVGILMMFIGKDMQATVREVEKNEQQKSKSTS